MPRDESEYAAQVAAFEKTHGKVRIRSTKRHKPEKLVQTAEDVFAQAWEGTHRMPFERQFKFHPDRGWTFDFAWPLRKLALELEGFGAGGGGGRHHLPAGIIADAEKFNAALLLGWRVLRCPSRGGKDVAMWVDLVTRALNGTEP